MSNYPPRLVNIKGADRGSVLFLDDDSRVTIDVSRDRLDAAIIGQGAPPLAELVAGRSFGVYVDTLDMTAEVWERVSNHLCRSSSAAEVFKPFPALWAPVQASYPAIAGCLTGSTAACLAGRCTRAARSTSTMTPTGPLLGCAPCLVPTRDGCSRLGCIC
jgi:hypothetical protein